MRMLSFSEWQYRMTLSLEEVDCPVCDGAGSWGKCCIECGQETSVECEACDEHRRCVPASHDWDAEEIDQAFGWGAYLNAISEDATALYRWCGKVPAAPEPLTSRAPYSDPVIISPVPNLAREV